MITPIIQKCTLIGQEYIPTQKSIFSYKDVVNIYPFYG